VEKAPLLGQFLVDAIQEYAIFLVEPDGTIGSWNAGAERIKGYTAQEVLGRHLSLFYTAEDVAAGEPQRLLREAEAHGHVEAEGWRVRKNGTRFWAATVLTALRDDDGRLMGFAKVTRNRSEKKAWEDELARSNADLEVFAGVISHDLREPLQLITAFAEILRDRLEDDPDDRELADRIVRAGRRMREMLDGVRAWAHLGGRSGAIRDVDLAALTASVVDSLGPLLTERGIELELGELPTVSGDPAQLGQVLQNLIGNAAKFGATTVQITATGGDGDTVISVADDGPGIPPARADEIFDMFSRLDPEAGVPGSGIGLAIAARVLDRHGGRIWVEDRPGGGSVFRFSLPPAPAA
jgi:PAS domain S-box-containing protein